MGWWGGALPLGREGIRKLCTAHLMRLSLLFTRLSRDVAHQSDQPGCSPPLILPVAIPMQPAMWAWGSAGRLVGQWVAGWGGQGQGAEGRGRADRSCLWLACLLGWKPLARSVNSGSLVAGIAVNAWHGVEAMAGEACGVPPMQRSAVVHCRRPQYLSQGTSMLRPHPGGGGARREGVPRPFHGRKAQGGQL